MHRQAGVVAMVAAGVEVAAVAAVAVAVAVVTAQTATCLAGSCWVSAAFESPWLLKLPAIALLRGK